MKLSLLLKRYSIAIISFISLSSLLGQPLFANNFTHITVSINNSNGSQGVLTCAYPSTTLTASTTASGTTTYSWTGPNSFTATGSSVTVSTAGTYTVTGTNSGKTGSTSVTVTSNTTPPPVMTPGNTGPLTCSNTSVSLVMPFGDATGVTVVWTGPNGFTSTDAFPTVSVPGTYALVVTYTATGCSTSNPTTVVQDITGPGSVTASNNGPLTCSFTSATLSASSSTTSGVTYAWAGPNGFTASGASAAATAIGTYTVTATKTATGCTATATTTVAHADPTAGTITVNNSGPLTCSNTSVTLSGSTTVTDGVVYIWSGPNGFSANGATATATAPGMYTLTATYLPGCTAIAASTTVTQNITAPATPVMTSNPVDAKLTCATTSIALNANSSTARVGYAWIGPGGFTSNGMTTSISVPGTYTVTATDSTNGCTSTSSTIVTQDTARPTAVTIRSIPDNALLTCSNASVVLFASSQTAKALFSWTGPNGFSSTLQATPVSVAGNYTVTITNSSNGCSVSVTAPTVTQNTTVPGAVSAIVSDKLTCSRTSVKLTGSSTTDGVTYAWSGPAGFTSTSKETFVSVGGAYTLTATDPSNGCSFSRSITVQADQVHPGGVTISSDGSLSCTVGSVTLTGNSSTTGVNYTWTGPNGFFDPEQITSVVDSGTYVLTVNNPSNSCNTTASIVVGANFTGCSAVARKAINGYAASLDASDGSATGVSGLTYKIYPNPASSTAVVELNVPEKGHVSVEVYNGVGVREKILFDGNVEAGIPYRWTLGAGSLATGIHNCMIRTNNKVYVRKLLIAR